MALPEDESEIIARILAGQEAAQRALYDAHVDRVFRLAYRLTGDHALAEDLTQDTFIRAFARLRSYRGEGPFGAWLHRIATSVIFSALRRRRRARDVEVAMAEPHGTAIADAQTDLELRRRIDRAVQELEPRHRLVFVMHDLEGFTHEEIAAAMKTPVGTAKARLSRARSRLRTALAKTALLPGLELD